MSQDKPPSFVVSFSVDDITEETEDCSNLTGSHCDDEPSQDGLGFSDKLDAGASYYLEALDGIHRTQIERQRQLHLNLKQQIARQQEKLDELQLKLRHCQKENEALNAEKTALKDELSRAIHGRPAARRIRFSKGSNGCSEPMQLLINANSKLMIDNARLQTLADDLGKSFKRYARKSQKGRERDRQTIARLQSENAMLWEQQLATKPKNTPPARSEYASKRALESLFAEIKLVAASVGRAQNSNEDTEQRKSPDSTAMTGQGFKFDTLDDERNTEHKDTGETDCGSAGKTFPPNDFAPTSSMTRSQSTDLFVEFEETKAGTSRRAGRRMCGSPNNLEDTEARTSRRVDRRVCLSLHNRNASRNSADLLVQFGEN